MTPQIETLVADCIGLGTKRSAEKKAAPDLSKKKSEHFMLNDVFTQLSRRTVPVYGGVSGDVSGDVSGGVSGGPSGGPSGALRLLQPRPARIEVCPPAVRRGTSTSSWQEGWQADLRDWLQSAWPATAGSARSAQSHWPTELTMTAQSSSPLSLVRREFVDSLRDIRTQQGGDLLGRVRVARSMRDLWHLRTEIYHLVSRHRDESEATLRLNRLNRFFPQRVGRPGVGSVATTPTVPTVPLVASIGSAHRTEDRRGTAQ